MGRLKLWGPIVFRSAGEAERGASPLHAAVRVQLLGCISLEHAAPAILLLARGTFDALALHAAAQIYSKVEVMGAGRMAQYLREEAQIRASRVVALSEAAKPLLAPVAQGEELEPLLVNLSARIALCARIGDGSFNDGVRAAQKEVEAAILRLPCDQPPVLA